MKKVIMYFSTVHILLFTASPVHAYLDPGSSSMVLQMLLGAVAGVVVFFKFFWRKFLALFRFGRKENDGAEQ